MTTSTVFDLFVAGELAATGEHSELTAQGLDIRAACIAQGKKQPVMVIRRHVEVPDAQVEISVDIAALLGNFEGVAAAKQAAWRRFQSANSSQRAEIMRDTLGSLANSRNTANLDVLKKALAGQTLSIGQIEFLVKRAAELELTKA